MNDPARDLHEAPEPASFGSASRSPPSSSSTVVTAVARPSRCSITARLVEIVGLIGGAFAAGASLVGILVQRRREGRGAPKTGRRTLRPRTP